MVTTPTLVSKHYWRKAGAYWKVDTYQENRFFAALILREPRISTVPQAKA